ncbi:NlpC/P60 family protein [Sphingomonas floccifaciens]|uniref:NlpC/P60 family protein n=1 Tax=Sphingomonas floccifaciens TaxID=1844115 RepID=A0ABW4NF44_9SPHN
MEAARGDLADVRLADRVFAPHYAAAVQRSATRQAPILAAHGGPAISEILRGESFDVLEMSHGLAWGVGGVDGTVGFVAADALDVPVAVTHVVCGAGAALPVGSRLTAEEAATFDASTIRPLDAPAKDFVALAESLVGTPAVAAGRSSAGVDGGGLVSLVLSLTGLKVARFVDIQQRDLGHAVADSAPILRGDLLFTESDVAIAVDEGHAIHVGEAGVSRVGIADLGDIVTRRRLP